MISWNKLLPIIFWFSYWAHVEVRSARGARGEGREESPRARGSGLAFCFRRTKQDLEPPDLFARSR